jgi:hypothetical protein
MARPARADHVHAVASYKSTDFIFIYELDAVHVLDMQTAGS